MTTILYEHPLNETTRNFLKLEQLFKQVHHCATQDITINHQVFFTALFAIVDILERSDIRGDLIKDLEKLEQNLIVWSKSPDVDSDTLQQNLAQAIQLVSQLKPNQQSWWQLKENKLLASIKQRYAIQGGSCLFDLPQLSYWLNLPQRIIDKDIEQWFSLLETIEQSLALVLKFLRMRAKFENITTDSGFYQDSGEGVLLLRIKIENSAKYYPSISGNKFRYSIRFMLPCKETGKRYSNQATHFQLARC
jgi:cell division protein ZapD